MGDAIKEVLAMTEPDRREVPDRRTEDRGGRREGDHPRPASLDGTVSARKTVTIEFAEPGAKRFMQTLNLMRVTGENHGEMYSLLLAIGARLTGLKEDEPIVIEKFELRDKGGQS